MGIQNEHINTKNPDTMVVASFYLTCLTTPRYGKYALQSNILQATGHQQLTPKQSEPWIQAQAGVQVFFPAEWANADKLQSGQAP